MSKCTELERKEATKYCYTEKKVIEQKNTYYVMPV